MLLATLLVFAGACSSDDDTDASESSTSTEAEAESVGSTDNNRFDSIELPEGATLETIEVGDVLVHSYLGVTALNGNYVIESENSVVVVDTSFQAPDPATVRAIADAVGKPIERVLITHAHPDHVGGLNSEFADVAVATTANVAAAIDAGDREIEILDGDFTIDGVDYVATEFLDAEAPAQMVIEMAGGAAIFIGDLVYHDVHFFLTPDLENWISILEELKQGEPDIVFPGHGPVADLASIDESIDYLKAIIEILPGVASVEEYEAAVLDAYPDRAGAFFFGFYAESLVAARGGEG